MADLIVEDGNGVADADSYASLADAAAYAANFGFTDWLADTVTDDQRNVALRVGTRYVDQSYTYVGVKASDAQALQWPRKCADYDGEVPPRVKNATMEAARISLSTDLTPVLSRGGLVKMERVDVIETEYMDGAPAGTTFAVLDMILKPLLALGENSNVVDLVRA
jgi:hypothetical protein